MKSAGKFSRFKGGFAALSAVCVFFNVATLQTSAVEAPVAPQLFAVPINPPMVTNVANPPAPVQPAESPLRGLQFDATVKEASPKLGDPTASFVFSATNTSERDIVIERVQPSCGCTVAKLPSQPWVLTPGASGPIEATINLAGKQGTFFKTLTVWATNNAASIPLTLKVIMPPNPAMQRMQNQMIANADHQSVFKGECANCHAEPTRNLLGGDLYNKACGICHEAELRDSKVPDLRHHVHPNDQAYWRSIITLGKPGTMMPGFGQNQGGPLTEPQLESLTQFCLTQFPSAVASAEKPAEPAPAVHN